MEFTYKKHDNEKLFTALEKTDLGIKQMQNYIPLYTKFFELNENNWNAINLNNEVYLNGVSANNDNNNNDDDFNSENIVLGILKAVNDKQTKLTQKVFFKYSPLLDPLKYITGKYDITDPTLLNLPSFLNPRNSHEKTLDLNNTAYVDSFFSYLTSKLLHSHNFLNGLNFYGSFLSIKEQYPVNIYDDIEYIDEFEFFHKNTNVLFTVDEAYQNIMRNDTRNYKQKINVSDNVETLELSDITELGMQLDVEMDSMQLDVPDAPTIIYEPTLETKEALKDKQHKDSLSSNSSCSSRSSNSSDDGTNDDGTNDDGTNDEDENMSVEDADMSGDDDDDYSTIEGEGEEEEVVLVKINEFPVQTIALECCDETLNDLIENDEEPLRDEEWESIVLQILMSLITYQNAFHLTHNDLHSNNIMYTRTEKTFLYYKVDNTYYKVPTFGRIFKIIDFGRAIYKFKGQLMCSDSFHSKGDAATQYNFPPYYNPQKTRVEPNFSFDLCRLSCSIYDEIVEDISEEHLVTSPILKIILAWCRDDKGRNIMYKKNGEERYPDFKLYKMISRKVHNHVPINVLRNEYFDKYKVAKKKIGKDKLIIDIDVIPCYI